MKKNKNKIKILTILIMLVFLTGCTKNLEDPETKKVVTNPATGQSLTENVLCKPTDAATLELYEQYGVDISSLPSCQSFSITSGGYEGLWNSIFVKPLAFVIIKIGNLVKSYGLSLIITSLLIRLIAFPITKKTAMQSELLNKAKPELDRLEAKYKDKKDQESMMKKSQEMSMIYKKHNINPISGCLFAFLQIPLFIAFLEAINRVPAIFEEKFIVFQLGTTPLVGIQGGNYFYIILVILVGITTYFSFKLNATATSSNNQMASMTNIMMVMIVIMSVFMTSALGIYWITTNAFTIFQNIFVKRSRKLNG